MTKKDVTPLYVRIPDAIKSRIESAAYANGRSMNAEMVMRLVDSFVVEVRPLSTYSDGDLVRELIDRYPRGAVKIEIK